MKISVIIPTWNRHQNILDTLEALSKQEIQSQHSMEVIVVDDNSTDSTTNDIINQINIPDLKIIYRKGRTIWNASIPRNLGAKLSSVDSECLLFLDSDIVLPPDRIQRFIDDYQADPDPMRVIIGPYHYCTNRVYKNDPNWYESIQNYNQDVRWKSFEEHPVEKKSTGIGFALACFGGSIMIPRKLFFKAGMYDEEMLSGVEDGDFGLTLARIGAVFSLDKGLLGWHQAHEISQERTQYIEPSVKKLNLKHFGSEEPDYGIIEASREAYNAWGIDNWVTPKSWKEEGGYDESSD